MQTRGQGLVVGLGAEQVFMEADLKVLMVVDLDLRAFMVAAQL